MRGKTVKIVLSTILIVVLAVSVANGNNVEAQDREITQEEIDQRFTKVHDIYSDEKLEYLDNKTATVGTSKSEVTKDTGERINETTKVQQLEDNSFEVVHEYQIDYGNEKVTSIVTYIVKLKDDGSINVRIPDARPSSNVEGNFSNGLEFNVKPEAFNPIPTADAQTIQRKVTITKVVDIQNNFVTVAGSWSQNCGFWGSSYISMSGYADAREIGSYWRSISSDASGALIYRDWCIFPSVYDRTYYKMGGTSYSDTEWRYNAISGWADSGLQFPWDTLTFKSSFYYRD